MDQSFTAFLGYGGRTFVTFTTFINIWKSHLKSHLNILFLYMYYLKILQILKDYKCTNFLLQKWFLSDISYRKVVLDYRWLVYISGLCYELQATYPDLVPRYSIQSGFINYTIQLWFWIRLPCTFNQITPVEFIWRIYLKYFFFFIRLLNNLIY